MIVSFVIGVRMPIGASMKVAFKRKRFKGLLVCGYSTIEPDTACFAFNLKFRQTHSRLVFFSLEHLILSSITYMKRLGNSWRM